MNVLMLVGSVSAAVFALISTAISIGLVYGGVTSRESTFYAAALVMFGAGANAGYHYATPLAWMIAAQVVLTGAFLVTMNRWRIQLQRAS